MILKFLKIPMKGWTLFDNRAREVTVVKDRNGKVMTASELLYWVLDKLNRKVNLEVIYKIVLDVSDLNDIKILKVM